MDLDYALRIASVPAWLLCLYGCSPAVWRLMRHRGRRHDPIWAVAFLLVVNRLSFLFHVSAEFSHASALALALTMAWFARWYQQRDA